MIQTSEYNLGGMAPPFARCPDCGLTNNEHAANCPNSVFAWAYARNPFDAMAARQHDDMTPLQQALEHALANPIEHEPADEINPSHYRQHPSGVECIQITEHMGFNLGNAVKYVWRADLKHESPVKDLRKAIWYIEREIALREQEAA